MRDAPPTLLDTADAPGATDAPTSTPRHSHRDVAMADRAPSPFDRARLGWGWLACDRDHSGHGERTD